MNTDSKQYAELRAAIGEALYTTRVLARKSQINAASELEMAQQQYGQYERATGVNMLLSTAVALLDHVGYDLIIEKREEKTKLGRPADPNKPVKYTMANPPPGKKGERIGGTLMFVWDDEKQHEWEEAEERAIKTGTRKPPWPEGHPKYDPNR